MGHVTRIHDTNAWKVVPSHMQVGDTSLLAYTTESRRCGAFCVGLSSAPLE
jgi:hypothetical protein